MNTDYFTTYSQTNVFENGPVFFVFVSMRLMHQSRVSVTLIPVCRCLFYLLAFSNSFADVEISTFAANWVDAANLTLKNRSESANFTGKTLNIVYKI